MPNCVYTFRRNSSRPPSDINQSVKKFIVQKCWEQKLGRSYFINVDNNANKKVMNKNDDLDPAMKSLRGF